MVFQNPQALPRSWPLELIDAIVGASCDAENPLSQPTTQNHLITTTYVSRSFYFAARRRLWETVSIVKRVKPSKRNTEFYEIIRSNPALRAVIRTIQVEVQLPQVAGGQRGPHVQNTDQEPEPEWVVTERRSFTKALCLLVTSNVTFFSLFIPGYYTPGTAMDVVEDEVLFALTAMRTASSLTSFSSLYARGAPPALIFGDPPTDSVRSVVFKGDFPSANSFRDYTIPRGSPFLDLSEIAYNTTASAISYFTTGAPNAGLPLLPKMAQLELTTSSGGHFLTTCLAQQRIADPLAPLGGHIPALEDLTFVAESFEKNPQSEIESLLKARGAQLTRFASSDTFTSRAIPSLDNLKRVSTLALGAVLLMHGPDYAQSEEDHDEETGILATLTRLLGTIHHSQPLETLSLSFRAYPCYIEDFGDALEWKEFWSPLDRAIERIGTSLSRKFAVEVELIIDTMDSPLEGYMEAEEELRLLEGQVQAILPLCKESRYVDLTIEARVLRGY